MRAFVQKHTNIIVLSASMLAILLLVVLTAATLATRLTASPRKAMLSFLHEKAAVLPQAIADAKGQYVQRQDAATDALQALFKRTELTAVNGLSWDGIVYFDFNGFFYFGETTAMLAYIPADKYPPPDNEDQKLVKEEDNAWRWEGGGVNEKGYIEVERLAEKWFYVESYYPT